MPRRLPWVVILLCLLTVSSLNGRSQSDQPSDAILKILVSDQYDLADTGRAFLLDEARRSDYFLLGELHGDNEIPQLIRKLWPEMWKAGYRHVAAEVSPWAVEQLETAPTTDGLRIEGLWTRQQANDVLAPAGPGAHVLWGCDMEETHPEYLIRQWSALNPADPALAKMVELVRNGYQRRMAASLLLLAQSSVAQKDERFNDVSLRESLLATLEIEKRRADTATKMDAQQKRELLMKTQFLEHLHNAEGESKVLFRFGRNHLHRGYDARGISTVGNFIAEFAVSRGQAVFNVGAFGAGGQATLRDETFSADERGDELAFRLLAEKAHSAATVYDLRPLRPLLHAIAADKRSPLDGNLTYWADAYDALICYKTVTPLKE